MHLWPPVFAAVALAIAAVPAHGCELAAAAQPSPLATRKPVRGDAALFTSGFGMKLHPLLGVRKLHAGVDWAAPVGTEVIAAGRGRIVAASYDGPNGNRVIVDHGGNWQTLYAHLSRAAVRPGDCVVPGSVIGYVGATGLAAGPHLHFEVLRAGQPIDPMTLPTSQAPDKE